MARHSTMVSQVRRLSPHPAAPAPSCSISAGMIWRETGALTLTYLVLPLERNVHRSWIDQLLKARPDSSGSGQRLDHLWEHTCFEAFLAVPDQSVYWELNVAPSGDWNLYRFHDYRHLEAVEERCSPPEVTVEPLGAGVRCSVALDPCNFWPDALVPEIALTMVVEPTPGDLSYWALSHPGDQADFHDRRGFLVP